MAYRIIWTKNAGEDLKEIVGYLKNDWSKEVSQNFINELYSKLDIISNSFDRKTNHNKNSIRD